MSESPDSPMVHEAVGPDLPLGEAVAALALGVIALLFAGILPALLGALGEEHRLSAAGMGLSATFEGLTMGLTTAAAGILLPPRHLKGIGATAALVLAGADFASLQAHDGGILLVRTLAGVPEGILLWLTTAMIARTVTPERWAGIFFAALTAGQLVAALLCAEWVLPAYGADGGFAMLALAGVAGIAIAVFLPASYAPLPQSESESGAPPRRGWFALFATLIFIGASSTVGVYLVPLALEAGLSADVARTAIWVSLAAQIAGGAASTVLAGHIRWLTVFAVSTVVTIATWLVFLGHPAGWIFIAANALGGFVSILIAAFIVPMTIEVDPSRRTAVLGGSTQVLAGALGPFAASRVVADDNVHGAIVLGSVSLLIGMALIAALHFTSARNNHTL
ncbi:MAG: hypothetical protein WDM91_15850 [Rhizomicrobium sp.]